MKKKNSLKSVVANLLGEINYGRLKYLLAPHQKNPWGGAFNGQSYRQRIFINLLEIFSFQAIVETGTFRGSTTEFFCRTGLPVYTTEVVPRNFGYSQARFWLKRNVILHNADSRKFLSALTKDKGVPKTNVFFYLDAHWYEDLPLAEEIEIIFSNWSEALVMVDDFDVPGSEYTFDDYGPGKVLNLEYLRPALSRFDLQPFFPAMDASAETGRKRGSVVLCRESEVAAQLSKVTTLRRG